MMLKSGVNFILLFDMATYTWIKLEMNEVGVGKAKGEGWSGPQVASIV